MNREGALLSSRRPYETLPSRHREIPPIFRVDIKSFISILKFDVRKQACACRHAADFVVGRGEGEKEREFLVS